MFLFTNSRSTFYRPGDTITPLKSILNEIKSKPPFIDIAFTKQNVFSLDNSILNEIKSKPPFIDIAFTKQNVFSLDNEAFRFLIARRNNIVFEDDEKDNFGKSWTKSAKVSIDLLKYMKSLKPHKIQDTVSLNEARRLILRLSVPLAEIAELIEDNILRNNRYKDALGDKSKSIDDLKKYLMVPRIGLKVITLNYPMTVCTNQKCVDAVKIEDTTKKNYKQKCHPHCYLSGVQKEVIGDLELRYCWSMVDRNGTKMCRHAACGHSFREHMHIYYETQPYNYQAEDKSVAKNIAQNKVDMQDIENKIRELEARNNEYRNEIMIIQESMAKFAHFLKNNAITPYNDTYKKYIEYLIDRERKLDNGGDKKRIESYQKLISTYESYKNTLETQLSKVQQSDPTMKAMISADEVTKLVQGLYKLRLSGQTIKDFYDAQKNAVSAEILTNNERTVRPRVGANTTNNGWFCRMHQIFC
ncbi:hypothetical protein QE152_g13862 [Popillia japonica]|uniref:DUF8206 domain-containing protein n=1 Tax=Popillia japonica TaxID=7064 RepID=A0AAW1LBH6_POPJA